jgi:hypothetical protein
MLTAIHVGCIESEADYQAGSTFIVVLHQSYVFVNESGNADIAELTSARRRGVQHQRQYIGRNGNSACKMASIVDKTAVISGNANIAEKQRGNVNVIANDNTANPDYSDDSESGKLDDKIVKEYAVNFSNCCNRGGDCSWFHHLLQYHRKYHKQYRSSSQDRPKYHRQYQGNIFEPEIVIGARKTYTCTTCGRIFKKGPA